MSALLLPQPDYKTAIIKLPTFHRAQAKLRAVMHHNRFVVARCGRRWGKNVVGETVAADDAAKGLLVAWCAPDNNRLLESYDVMKTMLEPCKKRASHGDIIETIAGGKIEFWSLQDENACRSRKYHRIIVDEAAFTKPKTIEWWTRAARPTLVDYRGRALVMSNTKGIDPDNFLYTICHEAKYQFVQFHAPSRSNPHLPRDEVEAFERDNEPLVYQQEYLAEFVDWSGAAFFALNKLLLNGAPVEYPARCEAIFTTIDSATKTGSKNDGTGMIHWALIRNNYPMIVGPDGRLPPRYSLLILDWDLAQIEGSLLEVWLPGVIEMGRDLARVCKAARGYLGAFIEDKSSGMILLQQAARRGLPAIPIDSDLTKLVEVGKDERAISVSGYVYREMVKLSKPAFEKVSNYKGTTRNHLRGQVVGFRIGDKDATREDDLADCFMYGIAIALGNEGGF
jgi:hypothetical protein